jgi:hypothetical protein
MRSGCYKRKRVIFCVCFLSLSFCSYAWAWGARDNKALFVRGGSSDEATNQADDLIDDVASDVEYIDDDDDNDNDNDNDDDDSEISQESSQPFQFSFATRNIKQREASDFIEDLISRSGVDGNDESQHLRNLITTRTEEYLRDLHDDSIDKLPDPRKLLHFLAPKIPAIKHSRDMELRIQSARSDMDCGVAASLIGILAHVCEVYDSVAAARVSRDEKSRLRSSVPAAVDMVKDRRFEQLVECVLCGVDVKKRKKEHLRQQQLDGDADLEDIEDVLKGEDVKIDEGLCIRDACRAAWGFAVLGVNRQKSIAGEDVMDILVALSLRARELLLARLQLLRQDDLIAGSDGDESIMMTIDERLEELSEENAEDAVSAMWAFACVRACTGMTSVPLLEVCSSVLCQDPFDLRRRAQDAETTLDTTNVGSNDAVDRLAKSEADMITESEADMDYESEADMINTISTANITETKEDDIPSANIDSQASLVEKNALIDWLSPAEVTDVLWAVALHGSRSQDETDVVSREEAALSETVAVLKETAFDRLGQWLREELSSLEFHEKEVVRALKKAKEDALTVEVVDAAALLASESAAIANGPPVENIGEAGDTAERDTTPTHTFEVVDAAALLASENVANGANDSPAESTTAERDPTPTLTVEVVDAAALLASENAANAANGPHVDNVDEESDTAESDPTPTLTVEVVDAAALLASENAANANGPPVENVGEDGGLQQIPVVDAKSLLSAERDVAYDNPDALASSSIVVTEEIKSSGVDQLSELVSSSTHELDFERGFTQSSFPFLSLRLFSPHDLCSLAWVVTELQDPLRFSLVDLISKIFLRLGVRGLDNMNGSDLSNLAWAMSKQAAGDVVTENIGVDYPPAIVMEWVSQMALMGLSDRFDDLNSAADHILQRFQPPELSRLLWALGAIHSRRKYITGEELALDAAGNVAVVGLLAASSDMSIFGTEDLARIMWAFMEVSDLEQVLSRPLVAGALGRVLSTVETSLLQWESGSGCSTGSTDSVNKESTLFASFFGRSRFHIPFLDHKDDDSEDVDEFHLRSLELIGKKRLPLLRELPIDPSTLCRVACSFARLPSSYPAIKGSETLLRIALRLLTSRNGRLLQECPRQDVIRLCEAVATNESPYGREQIGLFVRRVVRLLNESDEESVDSLSSNSPRDIATLVWSLGELGVKHQPGQTDIANAHRRLQLIRELPFLSEDQVRSLPSVCVIRLVRWLPSAVAFCRGWYLVRILTSCSCTLLPYSFMVSFR